ncbi:uncharacterized protein LOC111015658 [Momordica charantia]|uniref:Uncharacterized protein LOC111015658 n=1 Tax=Momordica charantia TaxID=3673 RepID=A0A6J1CY58_MOMCH|nr:uncharacterized protein LOC111015658 [Momordica charantia]
MASTPQQTSVDMNALSSFITAINERNLGISSFTWGGGTSTPSDCLPICIRMQRPPPAKSSQSLGKTILGLTFQAVLALFISLPSSPPQLPTLLFGAAVLISFAVSFAGLFLQTAYPRMALLFEKPVPSPDKGGG